MTATETTPTVGDPESWLETIWQALACYREDCIPEGDETYDETWNDICTAMAWIREALGLPDEVTTDKPAPALRTFEVILDLVGRHHVRVAATGPEEAIKLATTQMDQGSADIIEWDDEITPVDCKDITPTTGDAP